MGSNEWDYQILACANLQDSNNCANWSPGSSVSQDPTSRIYEIDQSFIDDLIADPSPLIDCDGGRFDLRLTSPGYVLADSGSGELAHVLGLQNGDIPTEINGMPLDDMDDVLAAFSQLYYGGETEFTLEVTHGSSTIVLEYEIVP